VSILAVEALTIARGGRPLVGDLSFALAAGEALHLRGGNGVGKTSLLEVLSGLRRPAAGRIAVTPDSAGLHWLGHKNALNLALTPAENLEFWCGLNGRAATGLVPVLEQLGVARVRHRPCRTLSAGQKRRSALARLLLEHRPLWLLDEPLDGLDAQGLELFAVLLKSHLDRHGAAIITSHQPLPAGVSGVRELRLS
jgi:heme exporter protein A